MSLSLTANNAIVFWGLKLSVISVAWYGFFTCTTRLGSTPVSAIIARFSSNVNGDFGGSTLLLVAMYTRFLPKRFTRAS